MPEKGWMSGRTAIVLLGGTIALAGIWTAVDIRRNAGSQQSNQASATGIPVEICPNPDSSKGESLIDVIRPLPGDFNVRSEPYITATILSSADQITVPNKAVRIHRGQYQLDSGASDVWLCFTPGHYVAEPPLPSSMLPQRKLSFEDIKPNFADFRKKYRII